MGDLSEFIESVSGDSHLSIEENFGDGFVRLRTSEAQRRQAKHDIRCVEDIVVEMLRNARDAHAHNIFLAISRENSIKSLTFIDDGDGIPEKLTELIFDPRVTSKLETMVMDKWGVHGRGMALYSIKMNSEESFVADSMLDGGSSIHVEVDLNKISEKTDQSTYPKLLRNEDGSIEVGQGPHNIIRTVVEFALEHKDKVRVYLGTPTDIVALLYALGKKKLSSEQILFCDEPDTIPPMLRPAVAADAQELIEICDKLKLPISERTAHRIIAGQIPLVQQPLRRLSPQKRVAKDNSNIYKDSRGLHISKEDMNRFSRKLESAFDTISSRYYVQLTDEPKIKIGKDSINIKFTIEKDS